MPEKSDHIARAAGAAWLWSTGWPVYAACAWAFIFAAISFYWAAGGTAGGETIGPAIMDLALARDPLFIAILWGTGALKVVIGLLALALVQPWGRRIPRWLLRTAAWCVGAGMALYGGASFGQHLLMLAGVIGIPAGLGRTAARWHLILWDPWWLLGGGLYLATARLASRRASVHDHERDLSIRAM